MQKMQEMQKIAKSKSCKCSSLHARHLRIHGILNHASGRTRLQHLLPKQSISAKLRGACGKSGSHVPAPRRLVYRVPGPEGIGRLEFSALLRGSTGQPSPIPHNPAEADHDDIERHAGWQARESGYASRPRTNTIPVGNACTSRRSGSYPSPLTTVSRIHTNKDRDEQEGVYMSFAVPWPHGPMAPWEPNV